MLQDLLFKNTTLYVTESVDIDVYKGKRRMAPFVNPLQAGKIVERLGYSTKTYKPPYIKPKIPTTAADLLVRQPGEMLYGSNVTPEQRAMEQLIKDLQMLNDMITRREEWMAVKALVDGQITVIGEGVADVIDFQMLATHKPVLSGESLWSAADTADPIADIRKWKRMAAQDSGKNLNVGIMSPDVYDALLACLEAKANTALLSSTQVDLGKIDPTLLPDGVTYLGRIKSLGMDFYSYEEWYLDPMNGPANEVEQPMIPSGKIVLADTTAYLARHYGAIKDLECMAAVARFPKSWMEDDPSVRMVMVQSAPLPVPHQIDSVVSATVL